MSTTITTPPKPPKPWGRRKAYAALGMGTDEYGVRRSRGDASTDRRRRRAIETRETRTLTEEAVWG